MNPRALWAATSQESNGCCSTTTCYYFQGKTLLQLSDELIWSLQPDSTIPRWHWVNITGGCPVHGVEIYRETPFYPWLDEDGASLRSFDAPVPYSWKI